MADAKSGLSTPTSRWLMDGSGSACSTSTGSSIGAKGMGEVGLAAIRESAGHLRPHDRSSHRLDGDRRQHRLVREDIEDAMDADPWRAAGPEMEVGCLQP